MTSDVTDDSCQCSHDCLNKTCVMTALWGAGGPQIDQRLCLTSPVSGQCPAQLRMRMFVLLPNVYRRQSGYRALLNQGWAFVAGGDEGEGEGEGGREGGREDYRQLWGGGGGSGIFVIS